MVNGYASMICLLGLLIIAEIVFQVIKREEKPFANPDQIITSEEFHRRVKNGDQLVLLNDLVLNVEKFKANHPGGKFSLQQNIGRDVSKFFYGGYALENMSGLAPHRHSNIARIIVNSLIIARLDRQVPTY